MRVRRGIAAGIIAALIVTSQAGPASASHCGALSVPTRLIAGIVRLVSNITLAPLVVSRVYVSPTGSDTTGDGSAQNPWAHIQYAINNAPNLILPAIVRTEVHVAPGTYDEQLTIGRSLWVMRDDFQGTGGAVIVRSPNPGWVVTVGPGVSVDLRGFTVDGQNASRSGILATGSLVRISGVTVFRPQGYGIRIENSAKFLIFRTTVTMGEVLLLADIAVDIQDSVGTIDELTAGNRFDHIVTISGLTGNVTVSDSTLTGSPIWYADGIRVQGPVDVTIVNNTIVRGIDSEPGDSGVEHNRPYAGIELAGSAPLARRYNISGNTVSGWDVGLGINLIGNTVMAENNSFSSNVTAAVDTHWQGGGASPVVDLGGGTLGSCGQNQLPGGDWGFFHRAPYNVQARFNTWGGVPAARIWDRADDPSVGTVTP